jgi:hypothetical protein
MEIRLRDLVAALKSELAASMDGSPLFAVDKAVVKTSIMTKETESADARLEVWVVKGGGEVASENQLTHEITLELKPLDDMLLGDD